MNILNHKPFSNSSLKILTNISDEIFERDLIELRLYQITISQYRIAFVFCWESMLPYLNDLVRRYNNDLDLYVEHCRTECYAEYFGCDYITAYSRINQPNFHNIALVEGPINTIIDNFNA